MANQAMHQNDPDADLLDAGAQPVAGADPDADLIEAGAQPADEDPDADLAAAGAVATSNPQADIEALAKQREDYQIGTTDLDYLASKHGVDREALREATGWLGGTLDPRERHGLEHVTEGLKTVAGSVGEGVGFGLPQKWWIRSQEDPNLRAAFDD